MALASRSFGSVAAVRGVTFEVREGEFFTLLGPSGCGKTTLLRMVAGFCTLDSGVIRFGDTRIDGLPPHRRNTAMVFQNYAIFPNLTVEGNIAYGLRARRLERAEIGARVAEAIRLVRLDGMAQRWPHQLSGGQLQRVAIARALVVRPAVLLLDEPLSNLDARLRIEMRAEIRRLQQGLGITALYVTHDQEEALAISDRIAVVKDGRIEQIDDPAGIYARPATPFVAEFMGTTNLLSGRFEHRGEGQAAIVVGGDQLPLRRGAAMPGQALTLSLRPERIRLVRPGTAAPPGWATLEARIGHLEFLGALTRTEAVLAGGTVLRLAELSGAPFDLKPGAPIRLAYDPDEAVVFPA
jgi:iron(III) transport system ATP-binding protein/putative spermidine/putrescine transport system ATP-binding protein